MHDMDFANSWIAKARWHSGQSTWTRTGVPVHTRAGPFKVTMPADLPVEHATKFEFILNLKIAKALGLTIAPALVARAEPIIK
jgi:hypothetical protein